MTRIPRCTWGRSIQFNMPLVRWCEPVDPPESLYAFAKRGELRPVPRQPEAERAKAAPPP